MSIHCVRGCTRKGRHLSDCEDQKKCKGCEPVMAGVGQLCLADHGRLTEAIGRIPDLIAHIRSQVEPGAVRRDGQVRGTRTPPAPLALDAVDAADALYAALCAWHDTATDELELTILRRRGWSTTSAHGQVTGLRAGGISDNSAAIAHRLTVNLQRICQYEWVGDMAGELTAIVRSTRNRWPDEERPTYLPTPCPQCDYITLVRHAPITFAGKVTISCHRPECGQIIAEENYGLLTRMVLEEQAQKQKEQTRIDSENGRVNA